MHVRAGSDEVGDDGFDGLLRHVGLHHHEHGVQRLSERLSKATGDHRLGDDLPPHVFWGIGTENAVSCLPPISCRTPPSIRSLAGSLPAGIAYSGRSAKAAWGRCISRST